jgi:hypothetical protein
MAGFIYRMAVRIKEFGERLGRVPVLSIFCTPIICLGLALREWVMKLPINLFYRGGKT